MFDLIVRDGIVIDGTGAPRCRADVGIRAGRITDVADLQNALAVRSIDAAGCVVAPGFIDVHNHSDGWLIKTPNQLSKTVQGFTTEILASDGISYAPVNQHTWREWFYYLRALNNLRLDEYCGWESMADFARQLDRRTAQNSMLQIPYANVRTLFCGFGRAPVDDFQSRSIQSEIRRGMEAGAVGLSTGLDYIGQNFASTDELIVACRIVAEYDGLYATHIRYKMGMLNALNEALHIASESGVKLHISHLKATAGLTMDDVFGWLERARQQVDLTFDVYPYQAGSTMLHYLLPYDVWIDGPLSAIGKLNDRRIRTLVEYGLRDYQLGWESIRLAWLPSAENERHIGRMLKDIIAESGRAAVDVLIDLLIEERMAVLLVLDDEHDRQVLPLLQHDLYMMGSDGINADGGHVHPRQFGSAARLIGPCVRDHKLFSLEDAVHRLAGRPARRFGIPDRGVIAKGAAADLVVFDPDSVTDQATYTNPRRDATGFAATIVGGEIVVRDGRPVEAGPHEMPGRFLQFAP